MSEKETAPDPARLVYGNLMLLKTIITLDELVELIKELPEKTPAELKIADLTISVQGELDSGYRHFPQNNYLFVDIKWGYEVFPYRKDKNNLQTIGYDPMVSVDLPLYPNYKYALKDFIGINPDRDVCGIFFCLPNYGGRIDYVTFDEPLQLSIGIETRYKENTDIIGKLYCSNEKTLMQQDIMFENNQNSTVTSLNFVPQYVQILLLSKKDGKILDKRETYFNLSDAARDRKDISDDELLELIKNGENHCVEFKKAIDTPDKLDEIAQTAVAFANNQGGIIIIGVDDHGKIVGYTRPSDKPKDKITNTITNKCQPMIDYTLHDKKLQGTDLIIVQVNAGRNNLYAYEQIHFYKRTGATNSHIPVYEINELRKQNSINDEHTEPY
ncbi:MAG: ATP-binding protein [Nitrososphaerota archaeon]|nr:ATP-binding protein [Nitrososphaerota archaeon]